MATSKSRFVAIADCKKQHGIVADADHVIKVNENEDAKKVFDKINDYWIEKITKDGDKVKALEFCKCIVEVNAGCGSLSETDDTTWNIKHGRKRLDRSIIVVAMSTAPNMEKLILYTKTYLIKEFQEKNLCSQEYKYPGKNSEKSHPAFCIYMEFVLEDTKTVEETDSAQAEKNYLEELGLGSGIDVTEQNYIRSGKNGIRKVLMHPMNYQTKVINAESGEHVINCRYNSLRSKVKAKLTANPAFPVMCSIGTKIKKKACTLEETIAATRITEGFMFIEENLSTSEWDVLKRGGFIAELHELAHSGDVDTVLKFIEEKKITHYLNAIYLGDSTNFEARKLQSEVSCSSDAGLEAPVGGGAEIGFKLARGFSKDEESYEQVKNGVVVHSILPIYTLLPVPVRETVQMAVKKYIDNKSAKLQYWIWCHSESGAKAYLKVEKSFITGVSKDDNPSVFYIEEVEDGFTIAQKKGGLPHYVNCTSGGALEVSATKDSTCYVIRKNDKNEKNWDIDDLEEEPCFIKVRDAKGLFKQQYFLGSNASMSKFEFSKKDKRRHFQIERADLDVSTGQVGDAVVDTTSDGATPGL